MSPQTAFVSEDRFTQEEFWQWLAELPSNDINHYELIEGRIVMTPPAGWPHGDVEAALVSQLRRFASDHGLGRIQGSSAGYDLPSGDTVEPDVSFISNERLAAGPQPVAGRFLRIVPNLAVEILSKATSRRDRTEKKRLYEHNGVDEYWIPDPRQKTLTIYSLTPEGYDAGRQFDSGMASSKLFPGLEIDLADLFAA